MTLRKIVLSIPIVCSLVYMLFVLVNPVWAYQFFNFSELLFSLFCLINLLVVIHIAYHIIKSDILDSEKTKKIILIIFFTPYIILYIWNEY
jgi:hypothetical protein